MLVSEILNLAIQTLEKGRFENPRLTAERLLSQALSLTRTELYLNFDRPLNNEERLLFRKNLQRRLKNEPLQYILGDTEFMSLPFRVNPSVLIPRPETELLVEVVIAWSSKNFVEREDIRILDIGTGSGCIAVSLMKYLENAHITAIDVSAAALETAESNAVHNGVNDRIRFCKVDFLNSTTHSGFIRPFDVIVSNPPYIAENEYNKLPSEIRDFEPSLALKDGSDGLTFYRQIAKTASALIAPGSMLAVEVGYGQAPSVQEIFLQNGWMNPECFRDLGGVERVVLATH